jgi:hypothetical protein
MSDTRTLLNKITAFRQRLESMPRLIADSVPNTGLEVGTPEQKLLSHVAAGSRTQAILEQSIRHLGETTAPPAIPTNLTARARRVLSDAQEIIVCLRRLADDPHLAGPPSSGEEAETDPLAIYFRETAAMMEPAVRLSQAMPDVPSVQLRLADGLDGILTTVRQRLAALGRALDMRRRDAERVNVLAHLLVALDQNQAVEATPLIDLASDLLAEGRGTPLRFLYCPPQVTRSFLGEIEFPAPARFVACHSLTTARVVARMVQSAPEWRDRPLDPIVAALLHDVGMLRVPADVLASPGPLADEQRRLIEPHARAGAEVIAYRLPAFAHVVEDIAAHHERLDGTGYPSGLKADQILPLARTLGVADTYAALTCPRTHRSARDPRTALTDALLYAEQRILDRFAAEMLLVLSFYPIGSVVEISDGSIGVVAANHPGRFDVRLAARPVLNLVIDGAGRLLPVPQPLDLAEVDGGAVVRTLPAAERVRRLGRHYPEWAI